MGWSLTEGRNYMALSFNAISLHGDDDNDDDDESGGDIDDNNACSLSNFFFWFSHNTTNTTSAIVRIVAKTRRLPIMHHNRDRDDEPVFAASFHSMACR